MFEVVHDVRTSHKTSGIRYSGKLLDVMNLIMVPNGT